MSEEDGECPRDADAGTTFTNHDGKCISFASPKVGVVIDGPVLAEVRKHRMDSARWLSVLPESEPGRERLSKFLLDLRTDGSPGGDFVIFRGGERISPECFQDRGRREDDDGAARMLCYPASAEEMVDRLESR
ncbi:hypothetical protein [Streptomyces sp. NPDC018031]|uniref:hypothetical protein n=1 Tax=Streptomyces sp. NPDC018031 TaxID=3365033 RepID=UPI003792D11F